MANEPSLSELQIGADPERGTGAPATIYDNRELGRLLNDNAQQKAHYDWQKYNMFLGNLKDTYKDLNEIAKQPVLEEDMPALRNEMAGIIKDISKDPQSFFGGGPKFGEVQGKIAQLQSKATESKGNNLFDEAHRQFFYRNPELETPENKSMIEDFRKQPLGSRKPYQLNMPGLVDMDELAKTINANVKKQEAYSKPTADNQFIEKGTSTVYDPKQFEVLAAAAYDQNDKRNIPIRETMQKRFQTLPPYLQQQIQEQYKGQKDPVKAWFVDDLKKRMLQDSETKDDLVYNPGYLEKEKLAQKAAADKADLAVKWANYGLAKERLDKSDAEDLQSADSVINEAVSKIKQGEEEAPVESDMWGRNKKSEVFKIADPSMLQYFGKLDKEGKAYDVPEFVTYDKVTHQLNLVFAGLDKNDNPIVTDRKPLNEREWLSIIVKRKFPNKDIGGINSLVEEVMKKNGNLYNLANKAINTPSPTSGKYKAQMPDGSTIISDDGKTWYDKNGKKID